MAELELKTFGERVAWLLKRRRLADQPISSQKELAAKIGMKPQQLNAYMNGRRRPNVQHFTIDRRGPGNVGFIPRPDHERI